MKRVASCFQNELHVEIECTHACITGGLTNPELYPCEISYIKISGGPPTQADDNNQRLLSTRKVTKVTYPRQRGYFNEIK